MDWLVVLLRLTHIVLGAVWVGAMTFMAFFLTPAIRDVGPDGGKVMTALQRRKVMVVMPLLAVGTLASGIWLYWRLSGGFQSPSMGSPAGIAFGLGGLASLIAFGLGMAVARPAMARLVALSQTPASAESEREREARMNEIQRLRARGAAISRVVAWLLIAAVAGMAVARYL
jgi:hypothetical protein